MTFTSSIALIVYTFVGYFLLQDLNDLKQVRLVDKLSPSVVEVASIGPIIQQEPYIFLKNGMLQIGFKYKKIGFGKVNSASGVIISSDGLILTCAHVVKRSPLVEVSLEGFERTKKLPKYYKIEGKTLAYVVGMNEKADIALLRVITSKKRFTPVRMGKFVSRGLSVLAIGFPDGFQKYVTTGVVSLVTDDVMFSNIVIEHGSSGGGAFDLNGRLLGLTSFMWMPSNVPVNQGFTGITNLEAMHNLVERYK